MNLYSASRLARPLIEHFIVVWFKHFDVKNIVEIKIILTIVGSDFQAVGPAELNDNCWHWHVFEISCWDVVRLGWSQWCDSSSGWEYIQ